MRFSSTKSTKTDRRGANPSESGRRSAPLPVIVLALVLAAALLTGSLWMAGCSGAGGTTTTSVAQATSSVSTSSSTTSSSTTSTTSVDQKIYRQIYPDSTSTTGAKLDKLRLVAPPGPMAIPMAYIALNNKLAGVAEKTEFVIWENADQLKAMVAGQQGDFVTMPSNNAAIFYNKGLTLQLLDISVWNITYLVTRDARAVSFADVKGQSLAVSLQGSVPDVMFQYIVRKQGLNPTKDFKLQYAPDPTQAAKLLLTGKVDNAVLSEALATAVVQQTKSDAKPLRKALAFDKAWETASSDRLGTPIAGTCATAAVLDRPDVVAALRTQYQAALKWMLDNPEEAGQFVETKLPELGLKAAVMTASLKSITWKYTPAVDAFSSLDTFFKALTELSPDVIGGKLPDDGFYYAK